MEEKNTTMSSAQVYAELRRMANNIEEYRVQLYTDPEHARKMDGDKALIQDVDDMLFHIQSELRDVCEFIG